MEVTNIVIRVVDFSSRGYKLEKFLHKIQHTQRKLLNFENWCSVDCVEVSKSAKVSKSISYFKNNLSLKNINLVTHFLLLTFFDNTDFSITLLLK